jgi:integrase
MSTTPNDPFKHCLDSEGNPVPAIWVRNNLFYACMQVPDKGSRRVPLRNDTQQPVATLAEAIVARDRLYVARDLGRPLEPIRVPSFARFVAHYLNWVTSTHAKSALTILKERGALKGWVKHFQDTPVNNISRRKMNAYVLKRTATVGNRTANLDVVMLGNVLRFARDEGHITGDLPTENWTPLKYTRPVRPLMTPDTLLDFCGVCTRVQPDGKKLVFRAGEQIADYLKLMAYSGARATAAQTLRWEKVDWERRQVTFFTKFDTTVVVDFNPALEAHLRDMKSRTTKNSVWVFPSPWSLGYFQGFKRAFVEIRAIANFPHFSFHDCRHFFASHATMSGLGPRMVGELLGHKDRGVLATSTYSHLNPEYKRRESNSIRFGTEPMTIPPKILNGVDLTKISAAELIAMLESAGSQVSTNPIPSALPPELPNSRTSRETPDEGFHG